MLCTWTRAADVSERKAPPHWGTCLYLREPTGIDRGVRGLSQKQLEVGDELLLSDALIKLEVTKIEKSKIFTQVIRGGKLKPYQGVNKKGGGLSLKGITEKDKKDLARAVKLDIDYVAVSFVKDADDIKAVKKVIGKRFGQHRQDKK